MKRHLQIVILFALLFTSCTKSKKTDSIPLITITSPKENDSLSSTKINIDFNVTDEVDLSSVTMKITDEENNELLSKTTPEISSTTYIYSNFFTINSNTKTKTLELHVTVINEFGNTSEKNIKFKILPQSN
jgi:Bacterial Ig domain